MESFWEEKIIKYKWCNLIITRCSNCKQAPLEYEVLSPYCPWCGCKMTNAEEED